MQSCSNLVRHLVNFGLVAHWKIIRLQLQITTSQQYNNKMSLGQTPSLNQQALETQQVYNTLRMISCSKSQIMYHQREKSLRTRWSLLTLSINLLKCLPSFTSTMMTPSSSRRILVIKCQLTQKVKPYIKVLAKSTHATAIMEITIVYQTSTLNWKILNINSTCQLKTTSCFHISTILDQFLFVFLD